MASLDRSAIEGVVEVMSASDSMGNRDSLVLIKYSLSWPRWIVTRDIINNQPCALKLARALTKLYQNPPHVAPKSQFP